MATWSSNNFEVDLMEKPVFGDDQRLSFATAARSKSCNSLYVCSISIFPSFTLFWRSKKLGKIFIDVCHISCNFSRQPSLPSECSSPPRYNYKQGSLRPWSIGGGDSRLLIPYRPIFERPWSQQRHQLGLLHAFWNCIETWTRSPPHLMTRKGRISKSSETGCGWRDSQSATVGWVQFSATFDQSNFHKNVLLVVYAFPFLCNFYIIFGYHTIWQHYRTSNTFFLRLLLIFFWNDAKKLWPSTLLDHFSELLKEDTLSMLSFLPKTVSAHWVLTSNARN